MFQKGEFVYRDKDKGPKEKWQLIERHKWYNSLNTGNDKYYWTIRRCSNGDIDQIFEHGLHPWEFSDGLENWV